MGRIVKSEFSEPFKKEDEKEFGNSELPEWDIELPEWDVELPKWDVEFPEWDDFNKFNNIKKQQKRHTKKTKVTN